MSLLQELREDKIFLANSLFLTEDGIDQLLEDYFAEHESVHLGNVLYEERYYEDFLAFVKGCGLLVDVPESNAFAEIIG